jgi:hypothetical protein
MAYKLNVGDQLDLDYSIGDDSDYTFTCLQPSKASVNASGVVEALSTGNVIILVKRNSDDKIVDRVHLVVTEEVLNRPARSTAFIPLAPFSLVYNVTPKGFLFEWSGLDVTTFVNGDSPIFVGVRDQSNQETTIGFASLPDDIATFVVEYTGADGPVTYTIHTIGPGGVYGPSQGQITVNAYTSTLAMAVSDITNNSVRVAVGFNDDVPVASPPLTLTIALRLYTTTPGDYTYQRTGTDGDGGQYVESDVYDFTQQDDLTAGVVQSFSVFGSNNYGGMSFMPVIHVRNSNDETVLLAKNFVNALEPDA